jgi:hypothetical protein
MAHSVRTLAAHHDDPPESAGPLLVRYIEEDDTGYLVGDPWSERTTRVQKRRAVAELSVSKERRGSSTRLLRWSSYALVAVILGGVLGVALGGIVVPASLIRLARLTGRIHQWRRRRASGLRDTLPVQASWERIQLLAALGQGCVAIILGSAVLLFVIEMR